MKYKEEIDDRMIKGGIPGASIAYFKPGEPIRPEVIGKTDVYFETPGAKVEPDTKFGAASLSKAVFSYLVLKMISDKKFTKPFTLDTPISEILPIQDFYKNDLGKEVSKDFIEEANKITPRMVLSHSSGIPINGAPRLEFPPGTAYSYGNTALYYLQKAIEKDQNMSLEKLAKAEIFQPLNMTHSSFVAPGSTEDKSHAANTLHTTPSDYALLTSAWMQVCGLIKMSENPTNENQKDSITSRYILTETGFFYYNKLDNTLHQIKLDQSKLEELQDRFAEVTEDKPINSLSDEQLAEVTSVTEHTHKNETLHEAFKPQISLMTDQWAKDLKVSDKDRQHLAWGLGFGLQLDEQGKVTTAFHSGDMNQWRGWVAMDMETKSSVVLLANGNEELNKSPHGYGHVLAELIVGPEVKLEHAFNWFFQKFGLAKNVEPGWKEGEEERTAVIGKYVESRLSALNSSAELKKTLVMEPTRKDNLSDLGNESEDRAMTLEHKHSTETNKVAPTGQEITQRFKSRVLEEIRPVDPVATESQQGKEHSSPSPFQTTLKPKLPGED